MYVCTLRLSHDVPSRLSNKQVLLYLQLIIVLRIPTIENEIAAVEKNCIKRAKQILIQHSVKSQRALATSETNVNNTHNCLMRKFQKL